MNGLKRSMKDKMVLGVFSGIAKKYKWDLSLVRIVYVAISLLFVDLAVAILAYIIVAIIVPEETEDDEDNGETIIAKKT